MLIHIIEHISQTLAIAAAPALHIILFSAPPNPYTETIIVFTLTLEPEHNSNPNPVSPIHLPIHPTLTLALTFGK